MHVRPPDRLIRATPPASRRSRRRRVVLGWMLAGSLLLHLAILGLFLLLRPHGAAPQPVAADSDVSVVFQSAGQKQAATASPNPAPTPSTALGNQEAKQTPATPTQSTAAPTQPAPPPQPVPPAPQTPPTPEPTPPTPQQEASLQPPPQPETSPTPPAPAPPAPQPPQPSIPAPPAPQAATQPPTVSLDPSEMGESPVAPTAPPPVPSPPPPLQLTVPTPPRPPPPRPRALTQQIPRSRSGFPLPQNWSLATGPESLLAQHGIDTPSAARGSQSDSEYKHLAGADPGEDWAAELHRWATDHAYYPTEAAENGEEGVATVQATINRYGKVTSVEMVEGSGSTFLDAAWIGEWRNANVPRFPPGTPEDTTTILYTIHYILVHRRR